MILKDFYERIIQCIQMIEEQEALNIEKAGKMIADHVEKNGRLFCFGTGHSHLIAEEGFGRAGGPTFVKGIWMTSLMLHEGLGRSTQFERVHGLAKVLYEDSEIKKNDVLLVISNSGRNAVSIEMAMAAKEDGIPVIAITSKEHSTSVPSRHSSGKRLLDFADIVLDNHGITGDASIPINSSGALAGPTSTITGAFLLHGMLLEALSILETRGMGVPIFRSANE